MFNYPIETETQIKFWGSNHKANTMQAYVAFSKDEQDFKKIAMRHGYRRAWRNRAWEAFKDLVNTPSMDTPDFTFFELEDKYWEVMPIVK